MRCTWAESDPLMRAYHDEEWGVPERDSRALWEKLMLDGFQAGLSWSTILKKRDAFRESFAGFDPEGWPGSPRRTWSACWPILASSARARRSRPRSAAPGPIWRWPKRATISRPSSGRWPAAFRSATRRARCTTQTPLSEQMSKTLKQRGFKFVGPVIVYAWMQATGIVNDHALDCFRRDAVDRPRSNPKRHKQPER